MKRISLCVAIATIFCAALAVPWAEQQVAAPTYKDGDYWWYRFAGKIYELTIVAGKLKIYDPKPDRKIEVEDERAEVLSGLVAVAEDDEQLVRFPLSAGKDWSDQVETGKARLGKKFGARPVTRPTHSRVVGIEDVATPAGSFRVFKIDRKETRRGRDSASGSVYYSPETRSVVKYEYGFPGKATKIVELTKYGSGK